MGINAVKCEGYAETAEADMGEGKRTASDNPNNDNSFLETLAHILKYIGEAQVEEDSVKSMELDAAVESAILHIEKKHTKI